MRTSGGRNLQAEETFVANVLGHCSETNVCMVYFSRE